MTIYGDLQFIHALGDGGARPSTQVVVLHATDNPTSDAAGEASYATRRSDKTSAHFYGDDDVVIQSLDTRNTAYGCLYHGNRISIQYELCGVSNRISDATMRRIAPYVARVCRDNGIPVRKISPSEVRNGVKGICGHGDITLAFPEDGGDHTDPGSNFPWGTFIGYVNAALTAPTSPTAQREDDMFGQVPDGVAFNPDNSWLDPSKAVAIPVPKVGDADWGPRWVWVASTQEAIVRIVSNGGGWGGQDVSVTFADGGKLVGLPNGTTEAYIGYKSGSGASYLVKGTK